MKTRAFFLHYARFAFPFSPFIGGLKAAFCFFFFFPPFGGIKGGLSQGTWSSIAPFIDSLENGVGIGINGKGYAGLGDNTTGSAQTYWWEYDPGSNSWSQKASFPGAARIKATAFAIGNYAYVGIGASGGLFGYNDFYKYDPAGNSWSAIANFPGPQRYTTVSFSIQGKGYVGTGAAGTPFETYYRNFYEYDPGTNSWTQKADYGGVKRRHAMGFSIGCKGYLGCGWDMSALPGTFYKDFWEYDPVTDAWTQKTDYPHTTEGGCGFSIGNKGYIGLGGSMGYWTDFNEYDPVNNTWTAIPNFPGGGRQRVIAFVIDSLAYVGTGNSDTLNYDFYKYTPAGYDTNITCCALLISEAKTNEFCGNAMGSATLTATGGVSPLTYQWSNGVTTSTNTGLAAGNYFYTVTDSSGCKFSDSVSVSNTGLTLAVTTISATDSLICDGEGTVTVTGGTSPYSYQWGPSAGNQTASTATGLCDGTYIVTITDNAGCTTTATVVISWPKCFTIASAVTNVSCNGGNNGAVNITLASGNPPFTYQWSNSATTEDISGVGAGTYTVTVTSSAGGGSTAFWNEDFSSGGAGWTLNTNGPGTNGNIPNFWTVNSFANCACGAGNYLHITCDQTSFGCSSSTGGNADCYFNDTPPFPPFITDDPTSDKLAISPNISTLGKTNITLRFKWVSDGSTGDDYCKVRLSNDGGSTWSEQVTEYSGTTSCSWATVTVPASYENISNFKFAFRWVNFANGNGSDPPFGVDSIELGVPSGTPACTLSYSTTITEPSALALSTYKDDVSCPGNNDGIATVMPSGGTSPYSFNWNNGETNNQATGLAGGSYSVTVTDANSCTKTASVTITEAASLSVATSTVNASCGTNNGSASASVTGGVSPFTYSWSNGQTGSTATALVAASYSVTVTDGGGCSGTASAAVNNSGGASTSVAASGPSCYGNNNGTAVVAAVGGTQPYTYLWSNGQTTSGATGLTAGTYYITVTDAASCASFDSAVVTEPTAVTVTLSVVNTSCGGNDGTITAIAGGGAGSYTYSWNNGQSASVATGLAAGTYIITITDGNGCTESDSSTVTGVGGASLGLNSVTAVSCNGGADGTITITVSGGTTPYTFNWSNSATTSNISGLSAGDYSITVTDGTGCIAMDTFTVTQPTAISTVGNKTDATCGISDGSAWVSASGGTPGYSYLWSNFATTSAITGIPAGNYQVTVTDSKGCTKTDTVAVNEAGAATVSVSALNNVSCNGGSDGSINLAVSGGTPPLTFSWSNGASTQNASGLAAGSYLVTVTDNSGCKSYQNGTITEPPVLTSSTSSNPATCTGLGSATATAGGGTGNYTYSWQNLQTGSTATGLSAGTYTVTINDDNGCTVTDTATVLQTGTVTASVSGNNEICAGENILLIASGGGSYTWSTGSTNDSITESLSLTTPYSVIVKSGACSDTAYITVTVNPSPVANAGTDASIYIGESIALTGTVTSGTPPYTYLWNPGNSATESITVAPSSLTKYYFSVTDAKGCSAVDSVIVDVLPCDAEVFVPNAFAPDCKCPDEKFKIFSDCIQTLQLFIFDRWGEKVWETENLTKGWDGTFNSKPMDAAVYVYYLKYTTINKPEEEVILEGNVNLIR